MKRLILLFLLFIGCQDIDNHGDLSIFKVPTAEQIAEWSIIDSVYKTTITDMVNVYKRSSKLNFNGNPWENKEFQREYSDLTWRGLYDYYNYITDTYKEYGFEEGEKILDSLYSRFDQMRDDLIIWKEEN
tara:strand:- start:319 stop:708 length:390 start_codon:yes stop_codon:yes gene_type:complete